MIPSFHARGRGDIRARSPSHRQRGSGGSVVLCSLGEMTRSLDMAQERLDAVEKHLARLAPHTPSAKPYEQELREIQLLVAQQAADLLGAEHPLVAHLQGARLHRPVAAITDQGPHF